VDASGNAYVAGSASSSNFPSTNAIQPTNHGSGDGFIAKLDPTGRTLVYATYLGGTGYDTPGHRGRPRRQRLRDRNDRILQFSNRSAVSRS